MRAFQTALVLGICAALAAGCGGGGSTSTTPPANTPTPAPPTPSPVSAANYLPLSPSNTWAYEGPAGQPGYWFGFTAGSGVDTTGCSGAANTTTLSVVTNFIRFASDQAITSAKTNNGAADVYRYAKDVASGDVVVNAVTAGPAPWQCVTSFPVAKARMKAGDTWTFINPLTNVTHVAIVQYDHQPQTVGVAGSGPHSGIMTTFKSVTSVSYDGGDETILWADGTGPIEIRYSSTAAATVNEGDEVLYQSSISPISI